MKLSTKLFIAAVILFLLPTGGFTQLLSVLCFIGGFALLIVQGITEITNKNRASHKNKNDTPPWEK